MTLSIRELEAEDLINMIDFVGCSNYQIIMDEDDNSKVSVPTAVRKMISLMTPSERRDLLVFGTGSVPLTFFEKYMKMECNHTFSIAWTASSNELTIFLPRLPEKGRKFSVLFKSLKTTLALHFRPNCHQPKLSTLRNINLF